MIAAARGRDRASQPFRAVMGWTPPPVTASTCQVEALPQPLESKGASDMKITTVGIDLAKNAFQVHGVDEHGRAVPEEATQA
jgi:hypothetical protein